MSQLVLREIGQAYGLHHGDQTHVNSDLQGKMGFSHVEINFLKRLQPEGWLVVRLEDFDQEVQFSFFLVYQPDSPGAARLRCRQKSRTLQYMDMAQLQVAGGGVPVAHCTVLLRKKRRNVVLSFLERDLTRRCAPIRTGSGTLRVGNFLIAAGLRALAPFCPRDADITVIVEDRGSGRLVAFYEKLGLCAEGSSKQMQQSASGPTDRMRGLLADVIAASSNAAAQDCRHAYGGGKRACDSPRLEGVAIPEDTESCVGSPAPDGMLCAICLQGLREVRRAPRLCTSEAGPATAGQHCVTLMEPCGHSFHRGCIERWLANSYQCPLCKRTVSISSALSRASHA